MSYNLNLINACTSGNLENFVNLLQNEVNPDYTKFIIFATLNGHLNIVKHILEKNPNIRIDEHNNELIRYAFEYNHVELVKYFINWYETKKISLTNIYKMALDKHNDIAILIVENINNIFYNMCLESNVVSAVEYYNNYADIIKIRNHLLKACEDKNVELVKFLVTNIGSIKNLHHAHINEIFRKSCIIGNIEIVKYLHDNFSVINVHSYNEYIFKNLCYKGHLDVLKYIIDTYKNTNNPIDITNEYNDILISVCKNNRIELLEYLVSLNNNKITICLYDKIVTALNENNTEIVLFLLNKNKTNPSIYRLDIHKLLDNSYIYNKLNILKYILENYSIDIRRNNDEFFVKAFNTQKMDVIKYLIDKFKDTNNPIEIHFTSRLFYNACIDNHIELVTYLLTTYPDKYMFNNKSFIINICKKGNTEIAKLLLNKYNIVDDIDNFINNINKLCGTN